MTAPQQIGSNKQRKRKFYEKEVILRMLNEYNSKKYVDNRTKSWYNKVSNDTEV